jgi:hypothetical protein
MLKLTNAELVSAWIAASGVTPTPDKVRRRQFMLQSMATDYSWEDTFCQHEAGLLGEDQFGDFGAKLTILLKDPGLRDYFLARPMSKAGPSRFHRFIDELLSETAESTKLN